MTTGIAIAEQVGSLRKFFPSLGTVDESIASKPLPVGAKEWFAIPRYELVAARYNDAVQKILDLIKKDCKGNFHNWREGRLGPQYLRQTEHAVQLWKKFSEEQRGHDILIFPARFIFRDPNKSAPRVRTATNSWDLGRLGAFAVGIAILTHRKHLKRRDDLWIDCHGDQYSLVANGQFTRVPSFGLRGTSWIGFNIDWSMEDIEDIVIPPGLGLGEALGQLLNN